MINIYPISLRNCWSTIKYIAAVSAAIVGALTNTGLVLGFIYLFYRTPLVAMTVSKAINK